MYLEDKMAQMMFLRLVVRFTSLDFKRKSETWNQLNIYNLNNEKEKWESQYKHNLRMAEHKFPKILSIKL